MKKLVLGLLFASLTSTVLHASELECEIFQPNVDKKVFSTQISNLNKHGDINLGKIYDWQVGATSDGDFVGIATAVTINPWPNNGFEPVTSYSIESDLNSAKTIVVSEKGEITNIKCTILKDAL